MQRKKWIALLLLITLVWNMGAGMVIPVSASSTFIFDGSNAEQYNAEDTIIFDLQTIDVENDKQVAALMEACKNDLRKAVFKKSVRLIGEGVFSNCYGLDTVDFSQATELKVIEAGAFRGCNNLSQSVYKSGSSYVVTKDKTLYLPEQLTFLGEACFGDTLITNYAISNNNTEFSSVKGVLCNKAQNCIVAYPPARAGSYTIPDTISEIFRYAFEYSDIQKLTVPSTVTRIGEKAFYNASLQSVTFDDNNNVAIGSGAFYQDPSDQRFANIGLAQWGGISQVKISEDTYNKSVAFIDNQDATACFTPYNENGNESYSYALGCDVYVVPKVKVSGIPVNWTASTNLNFYWNNSDYSTIIALYLNNTQVNMEEGSTSSDPITVSQNGNYTLTIKYRNKNKKIASTFMDIPISKVDSTKPAEVTYTVVDDICYLHSYDVDSGLDQIKYELNNADAATYTDGFVLSPGINTVKAWAVDMVGNTSKEVTFKIRVPEQERYITLDCNSKQLTKGKTFALHVSFHPDNITNRSVKWTSSDESIATVDGNGVVTGQRVGYSVITATSSSGYQAKCAVVVTKDPTTKKAVALYKSGTYKLIVKNKRADYDITYSSDDRKVCVVDQNGKITAKKQGEATVITRVDTGVRIYTLKTVVTVRKPIVKITTRPGTLAVGKTYRFKAYRLGLPGAVKWKSSNRNVATINKTTGKVMAQCTGVTKITAYSGKYKSVYRLKVK